MSRQFWHTEHACTNDPAELITADEIVTNVAIQLSRTTNGPAHYLLDQFIVNYPRMRISQMTRVFIACFSKSRDNRKQWRDYAAKGSGLCLGVSVLSERTPINDGLVRALVPVDYSVDSWQQRVSKSFSQICSEITSLSARYNPIPKIALELGLNAIFRIAAFAAVSAKQPQWSAEEEWRQIVGIQRKDEIQPDKRQGCGRPIRYLKVFMRQSRRPLALAEIIIGPNQDEKAGRERLEALLNEAGYPNKFAPLPQISASHTLTESE